MSDLISRQAAIDIERNATVDTNPSHFEAHQKFTQFMDDAEVSSFGRWQWSNGFNTALTAVEIDLKKLPSAHPDVPDMIVGNMEPVDVSKTENAGGWMERNKDMILQAGLEGREVEFRIGGRLFAIREKAQ